MIRYIVVITQKKMYFRNAMKSQINNEGMVSVYFELRISTDGTQEPLKENQMRIERVGVE